MGEETGIGSGTPEPAPAPPPKPLAPVRVPERIASVDVLRGVAVCGILLMNIYAFGLPWPAYVNPSMGGGAGALDRGTFWFTHLLVEMKFMTIFSMLFGAGLALMAERAAARGGRFGGLYYRRLLWLLLFGLVHAYLLWFGDILYWYAVCGVVLYPLRRLRPRTLIVLGLLLVMASTPISLGFGFFVMPQMKTAAAEALAAQEAGDELTEEQEKAIETWKGMAPTQEMVDEELEVYRNGYIGQVVHRAPLVLMFQTVFIIFFGFWRIAGVMLLGMALAKLGVLSASRSNRFYTVCCLVGYGIGLPLTLLGARGLALRDFDPMFANQGGYIPNYYGSMLVALGHLGLVMLVCKSGVLSGLAQRLGAVGRMALTNYLLHTVICTAVFYGWGLGLFGYLGRFALMGVVLAVWIFQLLISGPWLARYRFGPAEWLWRSLTYWKRQPMRVGRSGAS